MGGLISEIVGVFAVLVAVLITVTFSWWIQWALHFHSRIFRGTIKSTVPWMSGELVTYKSGYIEYVRDGKTMDCRLAEMRKIFPWRCYGYELTEQGSKGAGEFVTPPMKRDAAINYVASLGHVVVNVDDQAKFIFYKHK